MTSTLKDQDAFDRSLRLWNIVSPSPSEISAAFAAFQGLRVVCILPRLVMIRRAVAAHFYSEDLPSDQHRLSRQAPL